MPVSVHRSNGVYIAAGEETTIPITIDVPSMIAYKIMVEDEYDISLSVHTVPRKEANGTAESDGESLEGNDHDGITELVAAHHCTQEEGGFDIATAGVCVLTLDNSFSWLTAKTVAYEVLVAEMTVVASPMTHSPQSLPSPSQTLQLARQRQESITLAEQRKPVLMRHLEKERRRLEEAGRVVRETEERLNEANAEHHGLQSKIAEVTAEIEARQREMDAETGEIQRLEALIAAADEELARFDGGAGAAEVSYKRRGSEASEGGKGEGRRVRFHNQDEIIKFHKDMITRQWRQAKEQASGGEGGGTSRQLFSRLLERHSLPASIPPRPQHPSPQISPAASPATGRRSQPQQTHTPASHTATPTSTQPAEPQEEDMEEGLGDLPEGITADAVELVRQQTSCSVSQAVAALVKYDNDPVNAIMDVAE